MYIVYDPAETFPLCEGSATGASHPPGSRQTTAMPPQALNSSPKAFPGGCTQSTPDTHPPA